MSGASIGLVAELAVMDQLAHAALLPSSWTRYVAYRNALIADGLNSERVVETLSLFLTDLVEGHAANGVH